MNENFNKDEINEAEPYIHQDMEDLEHDKAVRHVKECVRCIEKFGVNCYKCGRKTLSWGVVAEDIKSGGMPVPLHETCYEELLESQD